MDAGAGAGDADAFEILDAGALTLDDLDADAERIARAEFGDGLGLAELLDGLGLELLAAVGDLVGPVSINTTPQETPWTTPLDDDFEHATYDPTQVETYFAAATQAALVLAEIRAPYRGRSTPVNAWWGSFDLAVSLYSGRWVDPPSNDFIMRNSANAEQIEIVIDRQAP